MFKAPELHIKSDWDLCFFFFPSAFDVTRILFQTLSLLWAHRAFLEAGGIVERPLACCQTAWYEFTMNLANLIK